MDEKEQIQKILLDVQWLRDNVNRLVSNAESERESMRDKHIEIHKRMAELDKLMRDVFYDHEHGLLIRIDRIVNSIIERDKKLHDLHSIFYDSENGSLVKIDRLVIKDRERDKMKQQIMGLWIGVALAIISAVLAYILK